jgi:hypothetical protein
MGFWHMILIGGLITWTACVFLRAVAARTYLLRLELVPPLPEESDDDPEAKAESEDFYGAAGSNPPPVAEGLTKRPQGENPNAKPSVGPRPKPASHGKPSGNGSTNGNGHAKVPVKRPGR